MKDTDFVVESLDEAERDLVLGAAVGGDAVPVTIDRRGELLIGLEPLPHQRRLPVLEEATRPSLAPVVPQLPEGFLEEIGDVEPLVGLEEFVKLTQFRRGCWG